MPALVDVSAVKTEAQKQLKDEAFKKAVALEKLKMQARKAHFLPWSISLQWPVKLTLWKSYQ